MVIGSKERPGSLYGGRWFRSSVAVTAPSYRADDSPILSGTS